MAIIFELWAECYSDVARDEMLESLDGLEHVLVTTGRTIRWSAEPDPEPPDFALTARSRDLSWYGVRTVEDALEATECGIRLYHFLRTAPDFRFARIDWDPENIPADELHSYLTYPDKRPYLSLPCVVDAALYDQLGKPTSFEPFREGYWWVPYRGETYRPLGSNDRPELYRLMREVFPELFPE